MTLIEHDGDMNFYVRHSDDMTAGAGQIYGISYGFYRNQLFTVMLKTKGIANSRALLDTLRSAYGAGKQPNEFIPRYFWMRQIVEALYEENLTTHNARAFLSSIDLSEALQTDEKAAAMRSGSSF
jgi:hypothetical protein